jgi:hypothetical protein
MVANNKLLLKSIPKYKCNALPLWARFQTKQNPLPPLVLRQTTGDFELTKLTMARTRRKPPPSPI